MHYTVSINHAQRGKGFRVRCFGLPDDDLNALGRTVYERVHRTENSARRAARELAGEWNARIQGCFGNAA